jgi:hypothetical protein
MSQVVKSSLTRVLWVLSKVTSTLLGDSGSGAFLPLPPDAAPSALPPAAVLASASFTSLLEEHPMSFDA